MKFQLTAICRTAAAGGFSFAMDGPADPVRVEHADAQPIARLQRTGPPLQAPVPQARAQVEWCSLTPASIFVCIFLYIFLYLCSKAGADFKTSLLWCVLVASVVAFVLQEGAGTRRPERDRTER